MKSKSMKLLSWFNVSACALCFALLAGCGDENTPYPVTSTGKVTQGPIKGATVFADLNGDRLWQAGEPSTKDNNPSNPTAAENFTDANGNFTLTIPSNIGSNYKLVSVGGVDQSTGLPQGLLMADPGSKNVTPATTLVAALTDQASKDALKAKFAAIGLTEIDKATDTAPPAVIAILKGVETVLTSLQAAATTNGKNNPALAVALAETAAKNIATNLNTQTTANLQNAATIATQITTATNTAITQVNTARTDLDLTAGQQTNIQTAIQTNVAAVTSAISTAAGGLTGTTAVSESTVVNPTVIQNSIGNVISTTQSNTTITNAPTDTAPPFVITNSFGAVSVNSLTPVISASFSEALTSSTVNATTFTLKTASGASVAGTVAYTESPTVNPTTFTATFTPTQPLTAGTTYTATLTTGIKDKAGNALLNNVTLTFSTTTGATGGTNVGTGVGF